MHWARTNMTSDKNGQTGSSYLLIDTVLSQRMFDLKSGKEVERVPNNLGQQWPVRLSSIPQKIKLNKCPSIPRSPFKKGHCRCHGECRSCGTLGQLCIACNFIAGRIAAFYETIWKRNLGDILLASKADLWQGVKVSLSLSLCSSDNPDQQPCHPCRISEHGDCCQERLFPALHLRRSCPF